MTALLVFRDASPQRFADQGAKPAGLFPVIWMDAAPGHEGWQGAFVAAPQRNRRHGGAKSAQTRHLPANKPP